MFRFHYNTVFIKMAQNETHLKILALQNPSQIGRVVKILIKTGTYF